jgi:hypothetical protein
MYELKTPTALGFECARQLQNVVAMRWFNAAPRVNEWSVTLADAYTALFDEDRYRDVELPDGATGPDGETVDSAHNVLEAFNNWLGRDIVFEILEWVCEEQDVEVK